MMSTPHHASYSCANEPLLPISNPDRLHFCHLSRTRKHKPLAVPGRVPTVLVTRTLHPSTNNTETMATYIDPSSASQHSTVTSAPIPLLSLLPLPLLALVASHLDVQSLLRLQRCSSTFHRLRNNDAYMSEAWRWAKLCLSLR